MRRTVGLMWGVQNITRVRNCPGIPISNSLFGLCLFKILSFYLFAFLSNVWRVLTLKSLSLCPSSTVLLTHSLSDQKPGPSSVLYACCDFVFVFVFVFCYDEQRKTWAQAVFVVRMLVSPAASGRGSRRPNTSWTVLLSHPTISLLLSDLCFKFSPKTMTNCNFKKTWCPWYRFLGLILQEKVQIIF